MKSRTLHPTEISSLFEKASNPSCASTVLKRSIYHLKVNILPTALFLVFCGMISLYVSNVVDRAKRHSSALRLAQAHVAPSGQGTFGRIH